MDWISVGFGLAAGWIICALVLRSRRTSTLSQAERSRFEAETRYLECLRRELALAMLDSAPDTLVNAYDLAVSYNKTMFGVEPDRIAAEYAALTLKYPRYSDLDMVGLRHFVPFQPAMESPLAIVERYLDISKIMSLLAIKSGEKFRSDAKERDVLDRVVREAADRNLTLRIKEAIGRYNAYQHGFDASRDDSSFHDADFHVFRIFDPNSPEISIGVEDKASGNKGIYSFFVHDSGKVSRSYSRADEAFNRTDHLPSL